MTRGTCGSIAVSECMDERLAKTCTFDVLCDFHVPFAWREHFAGMKEFFLPPPSLRYRVGVVAAILSARTTCRALTAAKGDSHDRTQTNNLSPPLHSHSPGNCGDHERGGGSIKAGGKEAAPDDVLSSLPSAHDAANQPPPAYPPPSARRPCARVKQDTDLGSRQRTAAAQGCVARDGTRCLEKQKRGKYRTSPVRRTHSGIRLERFRDILENQNHRGGIENRTQVLANASPNVHDCAVWLARRQRSLAYSALMFNPLDCAWWRSSRGHWTSSRTNLSSLHYIGGGICQCHFLSSILAPSRTVTIRLPHFGRPSATCMKVKDDGESHDKGGLWVYFVDFSGRVSEEGHSWTRAVTGKDSYPVQSVRSLWVICFAGIPICDGPSRRHWQLGATHFRLSLLRASIPPPPPTLHAFLVLRLVRQLASHLGKPGSNPGGVPSVYLHVEIVLADAAGRRVFSTISHFPRHFILALLHIHLTLTLIGSQDLDIKSRSNLFTHSLTSQGVSYTGDNATCSRCAITAKRKAVNWPAVFLSFFMCNFVAMFSRGSDRNLACVCGDTGCKAVEATGRYGLAMTPVHKRDRTATYFYCPLSLDERAMSGLQVDPPSPSPRCRVDRALGEARMRRPCPSTEDSPSSRPRGCDDVRGIPAHPSAPAQGAVRQQPPDSSRHRAALGALVASNSHIGSFIKDVNICSVSELFCSFPAQEQRFFVAADAKVSRSPDWKRSTKEKKISVKKAHIKIESVTSMNGVLLKLKIYLLTSYRLAIYQPNGHMLIKIMKTSQRSRLMPLTLDCGCRKKVVCNTDCEVICVVVDLRSFVTILLIVRRSRSLKISFRPLLLCADVWPRDVYAIIALDTFALDTSSTMTVQYTCSTL
ncbi:hypothetical protein PR048_017147 [Dryococelus australis]|uniref:Uncharacterized protein n=1 Tax=Dryococelus australis TaxID=614101 RepID=A0ABQ9H8R0_9NEOP|nr:hypothetical protein PR048_017147 [Dryococelus australis]